MTGTVKKFMSNKGFGFITPDEGGKDVFFHHSELQMEGFRVVEEGQRVEFEIEQGAKGLAARGVRLI